MRRKNQFLMLLVVTMFLVNCEDDIPAVEYRQQGYIKGTITGTARDNATVINESFKYTRYTPGILLGQGHSGYMVADGGQIAVYLHRQDISTGGLVDIEFELDNADDTTPDDVYFEVVYIEESDKLLYFAMENEIENDFSITNFSFDIATGRLKGSFSLQGTDNSTGNEAEVTGDFDVVIKEVVQ